MKKTYAFICHSSKDKEFVITLAESLSREHIWVDIWDMDLGEDLVSRIEKGIEGASEFIIILSKNSVSSKWVNYELNMALTRWLEDENFRIVCVHIDESEIPLRLKPFVYVDEPGNPEFAISKVNEFIEGRVVAPAKIMPPSRRRFIDRNKEIGRIEDLVSDERIRLIIVHGIYGIGKTDLINETIRRMWARPEICKFELTRAHSGTRLALDICAAASLPLPQDGVNSKSVSKDTLLGIQALVSSGKILIFDDFQNVLDEEGFPYNDLIEIFNYTCGLDACSLVPVFILSTRLPRISSLPFSDNIGVVKVESMENKYLEIVLNQQLGLIDTEIKQSQKAVSEFVEKLYGYPLAAKLAAPLLEQYSAEYLIENVCHITGLRIDLAKALLTRVHLSDHETKLLEVLALFGDPLTTNELINALDFSPEEVSQAIDTVVSYNLVEFEGANIGLPGLLRDHYWRQVNCRADFRRIAGDLANLARKQLTSSIEGSRDYVFWLSQACRMLFLCGKFDEAIKLRRDLIGELSASAFDIYHRREYELALQYCEEYLKADPNNFDMRLLKSRCLSRLEKYEEAEDLLSNLYTERATPSVMHAMGRVHLEKGDYENSISWFLKALAARENHVPSLRDIGEALMCTKKFKDAKGYLEKAKALEPMNPFMLSLYAELLDLIGENSQAITIMERAEQVEPNNSSFMHRLGRLYERQSFLKKDPERQTLLEKARGLYKKAFQNDTSYYQAGLSYASVAIDLGDASAAKEQIDDLRNKVSGKTQRVLQGLEAKYYLAIDDLDKSIAFADALLRKGRDVATLGICTKIQMRLAQKALAEDRKTMARSDLAKAENFIKEGLYKDPYNEALLRHHEELQALTQMLGQ
jgi:tetratricopeptide (TPR) repeat protein